MTLAVVTSPQPKHRATKHASSFSVTKIHVCFTPRFGKQHRVNLHTLRGFAHVALWNTPVIIGHRGDRYNIQRLLFSQMMTVRHCDLSVISRWAFVCVICTLRWAVGNWIDVNLHRITRHELQRFILFSALKVTMHTIQRNVVFCEVITSWLDLELCKTSPSVCQYIKLLYKGYKKGNHSRN